MKKSPRALLLVVGALVGAGLSPAPAAADPTFMNLTEWGNVAEGQTKATVEAACACIGQKTGYTGSRNGNTYVAWQYLSHVGWTYIMYRTAADGTKRVGYKKFWCIAPAGDQGQPDGGCSYIDFG